MQVKRQKVKVESLSKRKLYCRKTGKLRERERERDTFGKFKSIRRQSSTYLSSFGQLYFFDPMVNLPLDPSLDTHASFS